MAEWQRPLCPGSGMPPNVDGRCAACRRTVTIRHDNRVRRHAIYAGAYEGAVPRNYHIVMGIKHFIEAGVLDYKGPLRTALARQIGVTRQRIEQLEREAEAATGCRVGP